MIKRATVCLGAVTALGLTLGSCDWGQYRSGPAHTGSQTESSLSTANVARLEPLWSVDTGSVALTEPVTADGAVFVSTDNGHAAGGAVHAYAVATGSSRWSVDYASPVEGYHPALTGLSTDGDATVYVGLANAFTSGGAAGSLGALSTATGDPVAGPGGSPFPVAAATPATVAGDDVWHGYGVAIPMAGGRIIGMKGILASGRVVQTVETTATSSPITTAPAVADGVVYLGDPNGDLDAYDAAGVQNCTQPQPGSYPTWWECTPLWSATIGLVADTPVVADGVVYAVTGTGLHALATGVSGAGQTPLWQAPVAGGTAPAVDGDQLFVGSTGGVAAFAAGGCGAPSCTSVWTGVTGGAVSSPPSVANGVVYVTSDDGQVHAFAAAGCGAATCDPLWSAALPAAPSSSVTVANGRLFVGTTTGDLVAFALPAGA
jgi:hypothetical protein